MHIAESVFKRLWEMRGEPPQGEGGKLAIIHLDGPERYYDFVARYYPAKVDFAPSSGMFSTKGCWHIILSGPRIEISTVIHELTHAILSDLELPRWLNEGVAQIMEGPGEFQHFDQHKLREFRKDMALWVQYGLGEFWQGKTFRTPQLQRASYRLSRILVQHLIEDCGPQFREFLINASRSDHGHSEAEKLLGIDLELYARRHITI
jgi:hypothetical protein